MEISNKVLAEQGYGLMETIVYYENRPHPFSELWVNASGKVVLIIDHGICEQPVCGATWSYQGYVRKQNEISEGYRWLRYEAKDMESLRDDLEGLQAINQFQRVERRVDPRKSHPQIIGRVTYRVQLAESRKEMLQGNWVKFIVSL